MSNGSIMFMIGLAGILSTAAVLNTGHWAWYHILALVAFIGMTGLSPLFGDK